MAQLNSLWGINSGQFFHTRTNRVSKVEVHTQSECSHVREFRCCPLNFATNRHQIWYVPVQTGVKSLNLRNEILREQSLFSMVRQAFRKRDNFQPSSQRQQSPAPWTCQNVKHFRVQHKKTKAVRCGKSFILFWTEPSTDSSTRRHSHEHSHTQHQHIDTSTIST